MASAVKIVFKAFFKLAFYRLDFPEALPPFFPNSLASLVLRIFFKFSSLAIPPHFRSLLFVTFQSTLAAGIEPTLTVLETVVLPLNYASKNTPAPSIMPRIIREKFLNDTTTRA